MASVYDSEQSNRGSSTRYDNQNSVNGQSNSDDSFEDKQTLNLVQEFKKALQKRIKDTGLITEEDVEVATFHARHNLERDKYNIEQWKENSSINTDQYSHNSFFLSMAYAKTPKQIGPIFQAKKEQLEKNRNIPSNEEPKTTSLQNIIEPLKQLNKEIQRDNPQNLFAAILSISDDQIDRADRMFYSQACSLMENLQNYTFDNAHDQVQAIRLMHYESNDESQLRHFIERCRTFETAYSYLQQRAKELMTNYARSTSTSNRPSSARRDPSGRSIVIDPQNANQNTSNNYSSPSRSNMRPDDDPSNPLSLGRRQSNDDRSRSGTGDGRTSRNESRPYN